MHISIVHSFASGDSPLQGNDDLIIRAVLRSNFVGTKNCSNPGTSFPRKRESPDPRQKANFIPFLSFILFGFGFFLSCGNKSQDKKFFDVPGYFKKEIEYIKTNLSNVSKKSVYNGDTSYQEHKVIDINWEKEFAIFLESDINKPSYYANMKLETFSPRGKYSRTTYFSISKKLSVQKVQIDQSEKGVSSVLIHIEKANLISTTTIDAFYVHGQSYFIGGEQVVKNLRDKNIFLVNGNFK